MSVKRILKYPDPFLRKPTNLVIAFDEKWHLEQLTPMWHDMEDTLMESDHGAALAANQIGLPHRMIAFNQEMTGDTHNNDVVRSIPPIVINPFILSHGDEKETENEGCLSFPGIILKVPRWKEITVCYSTMLYWGSNQKPELLNIDSQKHTGFWARVFQHEIDHLEGKLFVDQLPTKKRLEIVRFLKRGK